MFFETTLTRSRIEETTAAGYWTNELLYDRFRARAVERPDQALVIDERHGLRWGEAVERVGAVARGLLDIGVRPGDVVQVQLPNRSELLVAVLAVERIGAVVNPVAPIFRANEVAVFAELARPTAVVTVGRFRGADLGAMHVELREQSGRSPAIVVVDPVAAPEGPADIVAWDELVAAGSRSTIDEHTLDLLRPSPNEVCEIMFTSGTTGQPKGVLHTQNTLNAATDVWLGRVAPDCTVFHMASTIGHQTGYLYGIRAPITAGGTVVYQEHWDPGRFAELIERHRIEASMGATPFLADLLAVEALDQHDLSSFRAFVCAGAAVPQPVLEDARDRLPCTVLPGWGMTETGLSTTALRSDPFARRATDGSAVPGNEVRVVDPDGRPVPAGVEGDLQFRGSEAFVGYLQGREVTETCWRDGWFDTGDRATMDADGYVTISGRTKDLVIRGGENVPVKEVEDALLRHPAVAQVAVVGIPDARLGEIGCAVVIPDGPAPSLVELTAFLDEQGMTPQFWPERLHVVDEFPMTPSGKVQKFRLRALVIGA